MDHNQFILNLIWPKLKHGEKRGGKLKNTIFYWRPAKKKTCPKVNKIVMTVCHLIQFGEEKRK